MANTRTRPPSQRLIANRAGLFFHKGGWTLYPDSGTIFSTLREALEVRDLFQLEEIRLVAWPEHHDDPQTSN